MSEATTQPSATRGPRVSKFGPNGELLGTITESIGPEKVGAILWGFGVAEMKTARRLAKYGVVSMQVRIDGPNFYDDEKRNQLYDEFGVAYCRAAMDKLAVERNVSTFVLMGNCGCANICFNAAMVDSRVVGLILTNPHVSKAQIFSGSLFQKILKIRTFRRIFTGKIDFITNLKAFGSMMQGRFWKARVSSDGVRTRQSGRGYYRDVILPANLSEKLRTVCARDVNVLIVCAGSDDSFDYLKTTCREALGELSARGKLSFESVESDVHVFSTDDAAASRLNETISKWSDAILGKSMVTSS